MQHGGDSNRSDAFRSRPERPIAGAPAFAPPPSRGGFWRGVEAALWSIAASAALYLGYVACDRALFARANSRALELAPTASAAAEESSAPAPAKSRPPFVARLEIPSLELSALVVDGVDDVTLRRAVGRIPSSALPGEPGNVALAGHRDTDFRALKRLRRGDRIELRTGGGAYAYEVEWIRIVEPDRVDVLRPGDGPTLTLVTCYPFRYIGRAPMRYVVRAREISRPGVVLASG